MHLDQSNSSVAPTLKSEFCTLLRKEPLKRSFQKSWGLAIDTSAKAPLFICVRGVYNWLVSGITASLESWSVQLSNDAEMSLQLDIFN